jgi:hypothetical protein
VDGVVPEISDRKVVAERAAIGLIRVAPQPVVGEARAVEQQVR